MAPRKVSRRAGERREEGAAHPSQRRSKGQHAAKEGRRRTGSPCGLNPWHIERLARYYHCIRDLTAERPVARVASAIIGEYADVDETQVRKDMAFLGVRGVPRVGFKTNEVMEAIKRVLGFAGPHRAIVVGAGRLGSAIAAYPGFSQYGLSIVALVDSDASKAGLEVSGNTVQPIRKLESLVKRLDAHLAILTVPADEAQELADRAVRAGIRAIWSFAPANITAPRHVALRHEHLSVGLAVLTHCLSGVAPGG